MKLTAIKTSFRLTGSPGWPGNPFSPFSTPGDIRPITSPGSPYNKKRKRVSHEHEFQYIQTHQERKAVAMHTLESLGKLTLKNHHISFNSTES